MRILHQPSSAHYNLTNLRSPNIQPTANVLSNTTKLSPYCRRRIFFIISKNKNVLCKKNRDLDFIKVVSHSPSAADLFHIFFLLSFMNELVS
jgi:hypothetical protein